MTLASYLGWLQRYLQRELSGAFCQLQTIHPKTLPEHLVDVNHSTERWARRRTRLAVLGGEGDFQEEASVGESLGEACDLSE